VFLCVGRGLGAGLIPHPRSPTKCLKGSISKKEIPTPEKGIRKNEKEGVVYNKTNENALLVILHISLALLFLYCRYKSTAVKRNSTV
jgi:hypothetical protein